jgi:hypothetical protein
VTVGRNVDNVLSRPKKACFIRQELKTLGGAQFNKRGASLQPSFIIKVEFGSAGGFIA